MQAALRAGTQKPSRAARMLPASMFTRELLVTAARPRSLFLKVVVPLVLTAPLVAGHAPTFWAAMLLTVLCAMIGAVGAAVGVARARESGLLVRLALVPKPSWRVVGAWIAGSAAVDAVQLIPAVAVVVLLAPVTASAALALVCAVIAVLLLANALGCAVAAVGGGPGEVLLDVSVLLAPLLFLGGLFTGVPRTGWRWVAATVDPFAYLHSAFIAALGGEPVFGAGGIVAAAVITVAAAFVLAALAAPAVLRSR